MTTSREFLVGLFTIIALVALTLVTASLGEWSFLSKRYTYYATFKRVKKLDVGAPVLVYGVQRGQVTKIQYVSSTPRRPVLVTMSIDRDVQLYDNAQVQVSLAGVIGDTSVNIDAGSSEDGHKRLPPGSVIEGEATVELETLVDDFSQRSMELMDAIIEIITDPENKTNIKRVIGNTANATEKLNVTLESVDKTFVMFNEEFRPLVAQLNRTSDNLNQLLQAAQSSTQTFTGQVQQTGQSLQGSIEDFDKTVRQLRDDYGSLAQRLDKILEATDQSIGENRPVLAAASGELLKALQQINQILAHVNQGDGTLGALVNDPRPFEELQSLLRTLNRVLTGSQPSSFSLPGPAERAKPTPTPTLEPTQP